MRTGTDRPAPGPETAAPATETPVTETASPATDAGTTAVVSVVLPPVLAALAGDRRVLQVPLPEGGTVAALLDVVAAAFPVLGRRIRDETGAVRRYVNLFVEGADVRGLDGTATVIGPGQELLVIQSVAGG